MKALKLITFDITGTLLKLQPAPAVVYSQSAKDFGLNITAEDISKHFSPEWRKMSSEHPNFGQHTGIGWHAWWKMYIKNTLTKAAPNLSSKDKHLDDLINFLIDQYKTSRWWDMADGAKTILTDLNAANVNLGVISNFDPRLETILEAVGIRQYFKFILTSYAIGTMKPNKKIFDAARAQIFSKSLSPSNCMHVGNDLELDYKAAINCGWSAAFIDPNCVSYSCQSDKQGLVFASLRDLKEELRKPSYQIF